MPHHARNPLVLAAFSACALLVGSGCAPADAKQKPVRPAAAASTTRPDASASPAPAKASDSPTPPGDRNSTKPTTSEAPPLTVRQGQGPNNDCWWHQRDGDELTAVWLSPRLSGEVPGGFRFLTLVHHAPRARRPVILSTHVARLQTSTPLAVGNQAMRFTLTPRQGKTWNEVLRRDDLHVEKAR